MSKSKDHNGKKAGKSKRIKLPKEIAGVKVPKELRKSGEKLIETARETVGREMVAAGVAALVAGLARKPQPMPTPPQKPRTVEGVVSDAEADRPGEDKPRVPVDQIADSIEALATMALRGLLTRRAS